MVNVCVDGIGRLGDFSDLHGKLESRRTAEFGVHLHDVGQTQAGGHERFRHVDGDIDFIDILKANHRFLGPDILALFDKPLCNHAVVRVRSEVSSNCSFASTTRPSKPRTSASWASIFSSRAVVPISNICKAA